MVGYVEFILKRDDVFCVMETNLLKALANIVRMPNAHISAFSKSSNRMNSRGESLELFVKNAFCDSFLEEDEKKRLEVFSQAFSYIGNQNNPPDIILRDGDGVEIKKMESSGSGIALNSSYPKDKIYADSPMITADCRKCEVWKEKDILYVIGTMNGNALKSLWFVYGDCYAANKDVYERIRSTISSGLHELSDIGFSETKELGRVNKVDPLGITYLRIRGMWHIENPQRVFEYISQISSGSFAFTLNALMLRRKYDSFPERDRRALELIQIDGFSIRDVKIKSPNNPAKMLEAKHVSFQR